MAGAAVSIRMNRQREAVRRSAAKINVSRNLLGSEKVSKLFTIVEFVWPFDSLFMINRASKGLQIQPVGSESWKVRKAHVSETPS